MTRGREPWLYCLAVVPLALSLYWEAFPHVDLDRESLYKLTYTGIACRLVAAGHIPLLPSPSLAIRPHAA
jgi:hypothetical protein